MTRLNAIRCLRSGYSISANFVGEEPVNNDQHKFSIRIMKGDVSGKVIAAFTGNGDRYPCVVHKITGIQVLGFIRRNFPRKDVVK